MTVRVALLALVTLLAAAAPAAAQQQPQRNVVFVLTDDLSSDLLAEMPAVRALARDGVSFSNYVVSNSLCCPSRSTIFTGKYPHNTGVLRNRGADGGYSAFVQRGNPASTFGTSLTAAGVRTSLMGKFLNGYQPTDAPLAGFETWAATGGGYPMFGYRLNENGTPVQYGRGPRNYLNTVLTRKGTDFIRRASADGVPFQLELSTPTPHAPYKAALQDREKFAGAKVPRDRLFNRPTAGAPRWLAERDALTREEIARLDGIYRKRLQAVQSVDRMVADLRRVLEETGEADETYVVFSSDNGFHTGQRRLQTGKQTPYDHDVRVPLIVAGPGVARGATTDVIAQNVDLRPTFEAMTGAPVAADVDGMSLTPWLERPGRGGGRRAALIEHRREPDKAATDDPDLQTAEAGDPPDYTALRTPRFLYTSYVTGEHEYYDLRRDPQQRRNVFERLPRGVQERLQERVDAYAACVGTAACARK